MTDSLPQNASANSTVEPWTVKRILEWTTGHLKSHGSDSPRLEAEVLLAHSLKCQRIQLYTRHEEVVNEPTRAIMRELVKRRTRAEPVAYLVGYREFFGLNFKVTPDVLIPRPDTETLVLEVIEQAKSSQTQSPRILDLCTGSGCIAVALAKNLTNANLTATDISDAALAIAKENAEKHNVKDRIEFRTGDLFNALSVGTEECDFVVSNPPYVTEAEFATLDDDVRLHEPKLALLAKDDGTSFLKSIIQSSVKFLKPGGWLMMEMDPAQMPAMLDETKATKQFSEIKAVKDLSGHERVIRARYTLSPQENETA